MEWDIKIICVCVQVWTSAKVYLIVVIFDAADDFVVCIDYNIEKLITTVLQFVYDGRNSKRIISLLSDFQLI